MEIPSLAAYLLAAGWEFDWGKPARGKQKRDDGQNKR
jgi:hypothetical protein